MFVYELSGCGFESRCSHKKALFQPLVCYTSIRNSLFKFFFSNYKKLSSIRKLGFFHTNSGVFSSFCKSKRMVLELDSISYAEKSESIYTMS